MKLDIATVDRVATLARLKFEDEQKEHILEELNRIIEFVEQLNEVDTEGVEPLIFMTDELHSFRKDEAHRHITHEEALKNAPEHDSDYFKVPKVLAR